MMMPYDEDGILFHPPIRCRFNCLLRLTTKLHQSHYPSFISLITVLFMVKLSDQWSLHTGGQQFGKCYWEILSSCQLNILRPRLNGRYFADYIFKCIFENENCCILFKISLRFVPRGSIGNNPALVHVMAWCQTGDKPLPEPMMT